MGQVWLADDHYKVDSHAGHGIDEPHSPGFIGENAYQAGLVAACLIDYRMNPSCDILIVNIARNLKNTENLNLRNRGFLQYFANMVISPGSIYTLE